jgi:hypothetical protein
MSDPFPYRSLEPHLCGDGPCADCGGPNVVWYTDDLLWNRVVRDHDDECILCLTCFIGRAEQYYVVTSWHLSIAPQMIVREAVCPTCDDRRIIVQRSDRDVSMDIAVPCPDCRPVAAVFREATP